MLTRLIVRNFKRFGEEVSIPLDSPVLFIGPNNSGKTTALQALALWELGIRRWNEKRAGQRAPEKRPGVAVSRRDLITVPVPDAKHLWHGLRVRHVHRDKGRQRTENIRVDIVVEGVSEEGHPWKAGLEFDYANEESFYCRPLRLATDGSERMAVPEAAATVDVAYLPPMSGLAANEVRLDPGAVGVRLGEGRTAEVLRNLCYRVHQERPDAWKGLADRIERLFLVRLDAPKHIPARGEIKLSYTEGGVRFDLTAAGRGLQQTLLLLAWLALNERSVLVLDEPDAHLEIIRQRQIYDLLTRAARETGCQLVMASHSEVLVREAAGRETLVAFVGEPHRVAGHGSQLLKALRDIGYADYEHARGAGRVLYVEGSTDLAVLRSLARRLGHERALEALDATFVRAVGNQPRKAQEHFWGLREAIPNLRGAALFDRLERGLPDMRGMAAATWRRREIENYLASEATLLAWAEAGEAEPARPSLFAEGGRRSRKQCMQEAMAAVREAAAVLRPTDPSGPDAKASEEWLEPVFRCYFELLDQPNRMLKKRFHELVAHIPDGDLDPEIGEKLDFIVDALGR